LDSASKRRAPLRLVRLERTRSWRVIRFLTSKKGALRRTVLDARPLIHGRKRTLARFRLSTYMQGPGKNRPARGFALTLSRAASRPSFATPRRDPRDDPQRLAEVTTLGLHHEIEQITANIAAEAVEEFFLRVNVKGWPTLTVEGAESAELPTRSP